MNEVLDEAYSPEWKTYKLSEANKYLTPESSPPKSTVPLPSDSELELPELIPLEKPQVSPSDSLQNPRKLSIPSDAFEIPSEFANVPADQIYIQDEVLYFNSIAFRKDDRMFLFDSGIKYSVRLLHIGKDDMTFQRTDGSKTHVSLGLLIDGRVKLLPK
jgi:hypothetical protein